MFQSTKQKRISRVVFFVYFILLTWLVLFKFATSISELPRIRGINFIPFHYAQETSTHLKEVLYNIIIFVPLGVYVQIFKDKWNMMKKIMVILLSSILFETIQYAFAIGASDITDLIGNTMGGIIGIYLCMLLRKIAPKKCVSVINVLGIMVEMVGVGLLLLLLLANR